MTATLTYLPAWATRPCAPWCTSVHADSDLPNDRHCLSDVAATPLSLADPIVVVAQGGPAWAQPQLRAGIEQTPDGSPRIVVTRDEDDRVDTFTLDEAERYFRQGLALVAATRPAHTDRTEQ